MNSVDSLLVLCFKAYVRKTFLQQRKQRPFAYVGIFSFSHSSFPKSTGEKKIYSFNQLLLFISNDGHLHAKKLETM